MDTVSRLLWQAVTDKEALFAGQHWDAVVVISDRFELRDYPELRQLLQHGSSIDNRIGSEPTLLLAPGLAGGRLITAPTGDLANDYEDVRRFAEAAQAGIGMAVRAGATSPLLIVDEPSDQMRYGRASEVALMGAGHELYRPFDAPQLDVTVGVLGLEDDRRANALEYGRIAARDLCGGDPEQMSPPAFAQYCVDLFEGSAVKVSVVDDRAALDRDYPLLSGVARASYGVARHEPRVVRLEYVGDGAISRNWMLAGKGVTFDTGGADLKVGGAMAGMSRDKGGAAATAGLMATLAQLQPKGVRVIAELGLVRNSIGREAIVPDEIITGHAGKKVRIGNTDAEGRLVLADLLSHLRADAEQYDDSILFSLATLTGHVVRSYGPYSAVVENSVARAQAIGGELQAISEMWGEPFELSRLRREDFAQVAARSPSEDLLSSNNGASVNISRGHQFPMAFLLQAAGLDQHQLGSDKPLAYLHLDIAGSAVEKRDPLYGKPTAVPMATLLAKLLDH
ncbi:M17 family metallopeptidase [Ferrimonas lipolytica]|uniref:Leucyl aminopeptidase family protein n=1 Tax=Ferrimonas lipolytica TaxID=2724191 RepID=A0A6H1UFP2_9GAMM|nr:leucyl aminopeptidase family protein [Ferrimonas lipolytica]QIZ77420.1 leucyl aminopeptidase family protein [Ferrimonas lipolytica]